MKCPQCNAWTEVRVKETRTRIDGTIRRNYECGNMHRFNTVERIETAQHGGDRRSVAVLSGRRPLDAEMKRQLRAQRIPPGWSGPFVDGWISAEKAHGVREQ